jgi:hypothetical protein
VRYPDDQIAAAGAATHDRTLLRWPLAPRLLHGAELLAYRGTSLIAPSEKAQGSHHEPGGGDQPWIGFQPQENNQNDEPDRGKTQKKPKVGSLPVRAVQVLVSGGNSFDLGFGHGLGRRFTPCERSLEFLIAFFESQTQARMAKAGNDVPVIFAKIFSRGGRWILNLFLIFLPKWIDLFRVGGEKRARGFPIPLPVSCFRQSLVRSSRVPVDGVTPEGSPDAP